MKINYDEYKMTVLDKLKGFMIGFLVAFVILWIFYRTTFVSGSVGVIAGVVGVRIYRKCLQNKQKDELLGQFKSMLESIATSYSSGKNTVNSFKDAQNDMIRMYGVDSIIVKEINSILEANNNNESIEMALMDFANRCGLEDIRNFAEVYESCNKTGGDIARIINDTRNIISEKIDIEKEIKTGLNSNKMDLNIMVVIELMILVMTSGDSSMSIASNESIMLIVKTVFLGIFVVAYAFGMKLTRVKI